MAPSRPAQQLFWIFFWFFRALPQVGHYSKYKSPFFLAVELGLDRIINFMHSIHLSKGGVAVNSPGPQGMLPLGVAALLGHCRSVPLAPLGPGSPGQPIIYTSSHL